MKTRNIGLIILLSLMMAPFILGHALILDIAVVEILLLLILMEQSDGGRELLMNGLPHLRVLRRMAPCI